eukprot:CAMPEP_0194348440 /NCGR_PEP_ID=MMETSP0171-20130528/106538_1 /TAXON_ID=218684 /ORGANISM="Corethron pennatum, Strain L29A3" /LENGTH=1064 /DNA_ID=CAMNT_0039115785 /DNA_START=105 /DNA_END=3299 /DNA_ORIENTATION=+
MDEETYKQKIAKANVESAANARKQAAEGSTESENNDGGVATQRSSVPKQPTSSTSSADEKDFVATSEYLNLVDKTIKELRGDTDRVTMNPDRFEAKEISHAISTSIHDEEILQAREKRQNFRSVDETSHTFASALGALVLDRSCKNVGSSDCGPDKHRFKKSISPLITTNKIIEGASGGSDNENVTPPRNESKSGQIPNEDNSQQYRYRLNIKVPPGKLGLFLGRRPGPGQRLTIVGGCKKDSPLYGKIPPGSRLMAVDGDDTSCMTISEITTVMSRKNKCDRMLTFASTSTFRINSLSSFDEDEEFQDFKRKLHPDLFPQLAASEDIMAALSASTIAQASSAKTIPENLPDTSNVASSNIAPVTPQTRPPGATDVRNPLNTQGSEELAVYVTDAKLVDLSMPDPLDNALRVVNDLSSMYLDGGLATISLSVLQNALTAAVACCDDVIDRPVADLTPLEDVPLGDLLKHLAGVSTMYWEYGSEGMPVLTVRKALEKVLVQCKEEVKMPQEDVKSFFTICISVCVVIVVIVGVSLVMSLTNDTLTNDTLTNDNMCFNDSNLKAAADLWLSNRVKGMEKYGSIGTWQTCDASDFTELFLYIREGSSLENSFNEDLTEWETSQVTSMKSLFLEASVFNGDISMWNVSKVKTMDNLFKRAASFNRDLSAWDISQVTSMNSLFDSASAFNGDVSMWNVSKVKTMERVFRKAESFTGNLSAWDTSQVTSMESLFDEASAFNGDVSAWDTSQVISMEYLFYKASVFNGDVSKWDTSQVITTDELFYMASAFNGDVSAWDTSQVISMEYLFYKASVFNGDVSKWDTSQVITTHELFYMASAFNRDVSMWNLSQVKTMTDMFEKATIFNKDLTNWETSQVTSMESLFNGASAFNGNVSMWNVSKVETMFRLFRKAASFNRDLSAWDTSQVASMEDLFYRASVFNGDVSTWDTSQVISMKGLFGKASAFNRDVSIWDTSQAASMEGLFQEASAFNGDLSMWNVSQVKTMSKLFESAGSFNGNITDWSIKGVTTMYMMFKGASSFKQCLKWNMSKRVDTEEMFDGGVESFCDALI